MSRRVGDTVLRSGSLCVSADEEVSEATERRQSAEWRQGQEEHCCSWYQEQQQAFWQRRRITASVNTHLSKLLTFSVTVR